MPLSTSGANWASKNYELNKEFTEGPDSLSCKAKNRSIHQPFKLRLEAAGSDKENRYALLRVDVQKGKLEEG
jgi:hypothetical protein